MESYLTAWQENQATTPAGLTRQSCRETIRVDGDDYWLYGAVDPETNEILQARLFPTTTKQTTQWFLVDLHRLYQLDSVEFLVDDADYLVNVLDEDGCRFQIISYGNRNAIERVF